MAGASDKELNLRLTADGKGLSAALQTGTSQLRDFKAQADAVSASGSQVATNWGKVGSVVGTGIGFIVGAATAGAAALVAMVKHSSELADEQGKLAQRLGTTAQFIQVAGFAAEQNGAKTKQMNSALAELSEVAAKAAGGARLPKEAFDAMGVAAADAHGKLKPVDQLLPEIAKKFSSYSDGPSKAALAQRLFGTEGQALIPTLNALGTDLDGVTAKAKRLGQVMSDEDVKAATEFNDQLGDLHARSQGFANNLTAALLPTLLNISKAFFDTGNMSATAKEKFSGFNIELKAVAVVVAEVSGYVQQLGVKAASMADEIGVGALRAGLYFRELGAVAMQALKTGGFGLSDAAAKFEQANAAEFKAVETRATAARTTVAAMLAEIDQNTRTKVGRINGTIADFSDVVSGLGNSAKKAEAPILSMGRAVGDSTATIDHFESSVQRGRDMLEQLSSGLRGPALAALRQHDAEQQFANSLADKANELYAKHKITLAERNVVLKLASDIEKVSDDALKKRNAELKEQNDLMAQAARDLADQSALWGVLPSQQQAVVDGQQKYNELLKAGHDFNGEFIDDQDKLKAALQSQLPEWVKQRQALDDNRAALQAAQSAVADYVNVYVQGGQNIAQEFGKFFIGQTKSWKDFGSNVVGIVKQMVGSIITQILTLNVINPFLQQMFGGLVNLATGSSISQLGGNTGGLLSLLGGGGGTPVLVQTGNALASSGAIAGGGSYSLVDAGGSSGGLFGGISSLFSASKWLDYGKNLWSGFQTGWSNFSTGWNITNGTDTMLQNNLAQMPGYYARNAGFLGDAYGGSSIGQGIGALGGIYAGYNRAQNADGAFGKVGGGLAYGVGTYYAGSLVAGGLSGGAAGLGAAAGTIPVVGWVALLAMLIDKFSGGNLLGTKYKPDGETKTNLSFGDAGLSIANSFEEKKKSALFGGNKYRWIDAPTTDDQKAYIENINAAMAKVRESAASALGVGVADIVTAGFQQRWNKDGKVTEEISTVLGKTYKEAMDKFIERVQAENVIAQIDAALGSKEASTIAEQYRSNADTLSEASKMLLQAQVDVKHGMSLLGDSTSLTDINKVVSQLTGADEKLIDTYTRLQTETQTLRSSLALTGADIGKTGAEFVKFADSAAKAAGGAAQLAQLTQTFAQAFYSPDELAKQQVVATRKQSDSALSALGLDPAESLADFRKQYEAALPTMSPEQLVQWQQAGVYLAQADAAQKAYDDSLKQHADLLKRNAADVTSLLAQLNPNGDSKAGTWDATLANINANFDAAIAKLKALGATEEQLAEAELDRAGAIANAKLAAITNYAGLVQQIEQGFAELSHPTSDFQKALATIGAAERDTIAQLNAAARAAGMQAAREEDLALVHQYAAAQAAAAARQLELSSKDLVSQLGYGDRGGLATAAKNAGDGMFTVAQGIESIQSAVDKFRESMLLDSSLSPLNTQDQYTEALKQLRATGDEGVARTALELARKLDASGDDYKQKFDLITSLVRPKATATDGGGGGASPSAASQQSQLTELQRSQLASQLAQNVADLAGFGNETFGDIAKRLGFSLDNLGKDLGLNGKQLDDYLHGLQAKSYSLADLSTLVKGEVDRLIAAIKGTDSTTLTATASVRVGDKPTARELTTTPVESQGGPVTVAAPREITVPGPIAPPRSEELQQALVDGQAAQTRALTDAIIALLKTSASGVASNEEGQARLLDAINNLERTQRAAIDAARDQRSARTASVVFAQ